nr:unnamed protein product [Callosobruchus analis]
MKECNDRRRKVIRNNRKTISSNVKEYDYAEYKKAKAALKKAIKSSKRVCFRKLCEEIDQDIWGKGYQTVTEKLRLRPRVTLTEEAILKKVEKLFPRKPTVIWPIIAVAEKDIREFDQGGTMKAAEKIKSKKAPGTNGIPPEALKILANENLQAIVKSANAVIKSGIFPTEWKVARLVLIEKAEKNKYRLMSSKQ